MKLIARVLACAALLAGAPAMAQSQAADFYRGKTLNIVVGYGPGGGYDLYARLLARYIGNHIPGNPAVIVQNMPGAAGLRAANFIAQSAPKDGLTVATFDMNVPLVGFLGDPNAQYDARKFTWLGSMADSSGDSYILAARKDAAAKSAADLMKPSTPPLTLGVIAPGASDHDLGAMLRDVFGFRLKIVPGYPSSGAIGLAIKGGEAEAQFIGYVSAKLVSPDWFEPNSNVHVLMQFARATRHPDLPDAPTARELLTDPKHTALLDATEAPYRMIRPYVAAPDTPPDRAVALQAAFMAAARDPELIAEAKKMNLEISPVAAPDAVQRIDALSKTPPDVLQLLRKLREGTPK